MCLPTRGQGQVECQDHILWLLGTKGREAVVAAGLGAPGALPFSGTQLGAGF